MKIAVASGKGGTGKTLIAVSLAEALSGRIVLIDADVEEPNAHIFIGGEKTAVQESSIKIPVIDSEKCSLCGDCVKACRFNALTVIGNGILHFPGLCHSCGACMMVCRQNAIWEKERRTGEISVYRKGNIKLVSGILDIGEAKPVPLILDVLDYADEESNVIIDVAPGVSCTMTNSVSAADYCILVTENTPFGLHDLKSAIEVIMSYAIPFGVIVNKWNDYYNEMDYFLNEERIPVLLRITLSEKIASDYSKGLNLLQGDKKYVKIFREIFSIIKNMKEKAV